jgi:hypothetical protein
MPTAWLKKNPFISMWLSAASRIARSLRGRATAQATPPASAAAAAGSSGHSKLWVEAVTAACTKTKPKRKR